MANVYWFGNGGNWSDAANHWSNNSGNSPASLHGAAPGTDDNAIFDANSFSSGSQTVTVDAGATCLSIDWSNATNSPTFAINNNLDVYGNFTLISAMTLSGSGWVQHYAPGAANINWAGKSFGGAIKFGSTPSTAGTYNLTGNIVHTGTWFIVVNGTLNTNGYSVSTPTFRTDGTTGAVTINLGASIIQCTDWQMTISGGGTVTVNPGTSSIYTGANFYGLNNTYYSLIISGTCTMTGNNTFNSLTINASATVHFTAGSTQNVFRLSTGAYSGHTSTIDTTAAGSPAYLVGPGGQISVDYLSIKDSVVSKAKWYAGANSTNVSGNSGWIFSAPLNGLGFGINRLRPGIFRPGLAR
jgi:hypothetical protein